MMRSRGFSAIFVVLNSPTAQSVAWPSEGTRPNNSAMQEPASTDWLGYPLAAETGPLTQRLD